MLGDNKENLEDASMKPIHGGQRAPQRRADEQIDVSRFKNVRSGKKEESVKSTPALGQVTASDGKCESKSVQARRRKVWLPMEAKRMLHAMNKKAKQRDGMNQKHSNAPTCLGEEWLGEVAKQIAEAVGNWMTAESWL